MLSIGECAVSSQIIYPNAEVYVETSTSGTVTMTYDGRAEIHKWVDNDIQEATYGASGTPPYSPGIVGKPGPRDFAWFTNHTVAFQ